MNAAQYIFFNSLTKFDMSGHLGHPNVRPCFYIFAPNLHFFLYIKTGETVSITDYSSTL